MLQELSSILEERDVQITISNIGDGKFAVHVDPQPVQCIGGGEHFGYTLPLKTTGTLQELELGLPNQLLLFASVRQKFIDSLHSLEAKFSDALQASLQNQTPAPATDTPAAETVVVSAVAAPPANPIPSVEVTPVVQDLLNKVAANKAATADGHTPVRGRRGRPKKTEAAAAPVAAEPIEEPAVAVAEPAAELPPAPAEEMTATDSFSTVEVTDETFTGSIASVDDVSMSPLDDEFFF